MTVVCTQCGSCFSAQAAETAICPECGSIAILPVEQSSQLIYDKALTGLKEASDKIDSRFPWEGARDQVLTAQRLFQTIPGFRDADQQAARCRQIIAEQDQAVEKQIELVIQQESKKNRRVVMVFLSVVAAGVILLLLFIFLLPVIRSLLVK